MVSPLTVNSLRGKIANPFRRDPPRRNSLTDEQAVEVYAAKGSITAKELASKLGIPIHVVYDIWARRCYASATISLDDRPGSGPSNALPALTVIQIMQLRPVSAEEVGEYFGVDPKNVSRIWSGRSYTSITKELSC